MFMSELYGYLFAKERDDNAMLSNMLSSEPVGLGAGEQALYQRL